MEIDQERLNELLRVEELFDELTEAIVGYKMVPATPDQVRTLAMDARRYRWLRDVADGPARDTTLDTPCGLTADEPEYARAHAAAVDAAIDARMQVPK